MPAWFNWLTPGFTCVSHIPYKNEMRSAACLINWLVTFSLGILSKKTDDMEANELFWGKLIEVNV